MTNLQNHLNPKLNIAVLLPCHNEEATIKQVIEQFFINLSHFNTTIYVYDNCSTDNTVNIAKKAGANVEHEINLGKGFVIKNMFSNIHADVYLLADGDHTYESAAASRMVNHLLTNKLDMVIGKRVPNSPSSSFPKGHEWGNIFFNSLVSKLFTKKFSDILSGYRVFSYRFVKSFPAFAHGFDTEVEFTIHCLELNLPCQEIPTQYYPRPKNSFSKINKYKDGWKILCRILSMLKEVHPLRFFSIIGLSLAALSCLLSIPLFISYLTTGLVPRIPTAILTTGLMILANMLLTCGLILDSVAKGRKERKYLHYLSLPWIPAQDKKHHKNKIIPFAPSRSS